MNSEYNNLTTHNIKFMCSDCSFYTNKQSNIDRHNKTKKHILNIEKNKTVGESIMCICGRKYKHATNLTRHNKTCNYITNLKDELTIEHKNTYKCQDKKIMMKLMNQNNEIAKQNNSLVKQTTDMQHQINSIKLPSTYSITPSLNNYYNNLKSRFNIEVFLTETCQNAINIVEFINKITITQEDLDFSLSKGFVDGICNIFLKELKKLSNHMRPLYCSDIKRAIFYIKDDGTWGKDNDNEILIKQLNVLSNKQYNYLKTVWFCNNKHLIINESELQHKHCLYLVAIGHSTTDEKYKQTIINNIKKMVCINK
jgi:hypothetical protein